jgi:hypothetical protein
VEVRSVGRLGTLTAWIAAACCLPYFVLKVLWTVGIPAGVADASELDAAGWAAANALMALVQLVGLALVISLARPWAQRLPAWLLLFPAWVGIGLLFQVAVGATLVGASSPASSDFGVFEPWVFLMVYASFAGEGVALAIVFVCYARARWGALLGTRTASVGAPRQRLDVVAAMTVVVCLVWFVLATGSAVAARVPQVVAALAAAAGLIALSGRWGRQTRLWVPVILVWVGSGALAGFDGLVLTLNHLLGRLLIGGSGPAWRLTETLATIKVLTGVVAAVVGVLAIRDRHRVSTMD